MQRLREALVRPPWYESRFTGLFTSYARLPTRPHDPDLDIVGADLPPRGPREKSMAVGGAAFHREAAVGACVGEAVERLEAHYLFDDLVEYSTFELWSRPEPVVNPARWVLFHPDQYHQPGFPFAPFRPDSTVPWVPVREAGTGLPWWVPADMVYLFHAPQGPFGRLCPSISTGMAAGPPDAPIILRGLQEIVERDALMGTWWGQYPLELHQPEAVLALLPEQLVRRILRPHLTYSFYRIQSPYSGHVALVTVSATEQEGFCFAAGSACRETRALAWEKAIAEALQTLVYVRQLLRVPEEPGAPRSFAAHASFYSRHRELLAHTVFARASRTHSQTVPEVENLEVIRQRLGPDRPVLFRCLSPPGLVEQGIELCVMRVIVPGLQPLHGDHALPQLGGPLWDRPMADWAEQQPHPFA
jgi:ribosomal protein S12 methylthiotransferase accessory factor